MKLALFDIDGTLTDSTDVDDFCMTETFQHFLGNNVECDWESVSHVTDPVIVRETVERTTGSPCTEEQYAEIKQHFLSLLAEKARTEPERFSAVPGAHAFLEILAARGVVIGLGTGSWKASAEIKLNTAGFNFSNYFFAHADLRNSRAGIASNVFAQATAHHGKLPSQWYYFGDGSWDLKTMKQLDWPFIGVDVQENEKLQSLGAKQVIHNYNHIQVEDLFSF